MNAAERYNAMVKARQEQQARLAAAYDQSYWDRFAHTYRFDPNRLPEMSIREVIRRLWMDDHVIEGRRRRGTSRIAAGAAGAVAAQRGAFGGDARAVPPARLAA